MAAYECDKCGSRKRHPYFWGKSHGFDCSDKQNPGTFRMVAKKKATKVAKETP